MDMILFLSGLFQVFLALTTGIFFIFFTFSFFKKLTKDIDEVEQLKRGNVSLSLLCAAIVFSVVLIVKNAIEPGVDLFSLSLRDPQGFAVESILLHLGIMTAHLVIAGIFAFVSVFLGFKLFMLLTRDLDEMQEIRNDNLAVGILISVVIISIALFVSPGIRTILEALIPFPAAGNPGG